LATRTVLALVFTLAAACGGSAFDGTVYRGTGYAFRVPERPASWEQLEVSDASLAYRDTASDATIAVNGRCGRDGEDVPLASLTQHLFMQFSERDILSQEVVPFDGREAMHTVAVAKLDGVAHKFDIWVMKKDGCVYDLVYFARPHSYEAGVSVFRRFVQGFSTVSPNGS
jgi:hypothetical protein